MNYPVVATGKVGDEFDICGRNETADWVQLCGYAEPQRWIYAGTDLKLAELVGLKEIRQLRLVAPPPMPTSTPMPPTLLGLQRPVSDVFWIRHRPSYLPLVECPDENPQIGILESSYPQCRVTNSFWSPEGKYWGPIVKDDNGENVDYAPVGLLSCDHFGCSPDSTEQYKVYAVDNGTVRNIDYLGDSIGWKVEILHTEGMIGNYGHIDDPHEFVHVGQDIQAGQQIGKVTSKWDYFLAFFIFKKDGTKIIYYNPLELDLPIP